MQPTTKQLRTILDDRGYLLEILRSDDSCFSRFGQLYLSTINPGVIKGFHIHQRKTDHITCIEGQVKLVVIEGDQLGSLDSLYEYHLCPMSPQLVTIPPGYWHGWMCVGTKPAILINTTTEPFNPLDKDEARVDPISNPWSYKWEIKNG